MNHEFPNVMNDGFLRYDVCIQVSSESLHWRFSRVGRPTAEPSLDTFFASFLFLLACLSPVSTSMIHLHVFVLYTFNCIVSHRRKVLKRQFFDTTGTGSLLVRKVGIEGNLWTAISALFLSRRARMYGSCLFG